MSCIRIAMWSGPRTISTAMLRAWENRSDTMVWDEPLYPLWLEATGATHPGREQILKASVHDLDGEDLNRRLASVPPGVSIFYQKHMAHHALSSFSRAWMEGARHAFLIRDPERLLASLAAKLPDAGLDETGLPQQVELLRYLDEQGHPPPPVIDSDDVLNDPRGMLRALCAALDVPFEERMLAWPSGPRDTDGVWADWWYDSVRASTCFVRPDRAPQPVPSLQAAVLPRCRELYDELAAMRLRPVEGDCHATGT
ncbi:MAG: HAD family hydrolase [Phycisphaerae bacterium]|nr:HAD family hydrolase [Phycisphaerae bacterium]MBT5584109.1 HAD family hydrolase [Phycisphaerae bacterium]